MTRRTELFLIVAVGCCVAFVSLASSPPARALPPIDPQCLAGGTLAPGGCAVTGSGGLASSAGGALTAVTLGAVVGWVLSGASYVLAATGQVLSQTTEPQLTSTWFSATYWRVAGLAAVLTLPFLFAAVIQGLIRSDVGLLIRAAFGYLPLAMLAVAIAAPLTMLLLAASDQMSGVVSSAAGDGGENFLRHAIGSLGAIAANFASPFVLFLVGLLTVAGALVLWIELLVREAAVYVIVLMLPLAFSAFVWPARRLWAIRSIELLVALILSKFVIVAVLALGGAALDRGLNQSVPGLLAGGVLMALASFAPWAMLRLIPLAELAGAAAGSLRTGSSAALLRLQQSEARAWQGDRWLSGMTDTWPSKISEMRDAASGFAARRADESRRASSDGGSLSDSGAGPLSSAGTPPPDPQAPQPREPTAAPPPPDPSTPAPPREPSAAPPPLEPSRDLPSDVLDLTNPAGATAPAGEDNS